MLARGLCSPGQSAASLGGQANGCLGASPDMEPPIPTTTLKYLVTAVEQGRCWCLGRPPSTTCGGWAMPVGWHSNASGMAFDTLIGCCVGCVHAVWDRHYAHTQSIDVLLACGVNNVGHGDRASSIIMELQYLGNKILSHSSNWLLIVTIPLAPRHCAPGKVEEARTVNRWILDTNQRMTGKQLKLHQFGTENAKGLGQLDISNL